MKQFIYKSFIGSLIFFGTGLILFGIVKGRNGLQSSPGDKVTSAVWNNLVNHIDYTYSTTESSTGKKWIDGKTIYRKVLNIGALGSANTTAARGTSTSAHGISGLSSVISLNGYATNGANWRDLGHYSGYYNGVTQGNNLLCDSTNCYVYYSGNRNGYSAIMIIEYTKN